MPIETVNILSTAGAVVRFLNLGYELVGFGIEVHSVGEDVPNGHLELEKLSQNLHSVAGALKTPLRPDSGCLTKEEEALESLIAACERVLADVLLRLYRLSIASIKHQGDEKAPKEALQRVWPKVDVNALKQRLSKLRLELDANVKPFLRAIVNGLPPEHLAALDPDAKSLLRLLEGEANGSIPSEEGNQQKADSAALQYDANDAVTEAGSGRDGKENEADQESLTSRLAAVMKSASPDKVGILQEFFLEHLSFTSMKDREEEVTEAHKKTFEWIFQDEGPSAARGTASKPATHFLEWLKTDTKGGVYWINGKAGSGKSTLMQFINAHPKTGESLEVWADQEPLARAGFFFWTSGSFEQRSQVGLLRYLLFQLLDQHRNMIPMTFPELWIHFWNAKTQDRIKAVLSWSLPLLMSGLKLFLHHAIAKMKICLLIDGLDEFDGDHGEIIDLFTSIVNSSNHRVKVCLSSRPWPVFEHAFQSIPSLKLQDLTSGDMTQYVVDKLKQDVRVRRIAKKEPESCQDLVAEIVNRADGVFLWITLIVRALLQSLCTDDKVSNLQGRLRTFPTDLDDLFRYTLFQVQPKADLKEASRIFQLIRAREKICDSTRNYTSASSTLWDLALAGDMDLHFALQAPVHQASGNDVTRECQNIKDRIGSKCAGLLATHDKAARRAGNPIRFKDDNPFRTAHKLAHTRVTYLHRTVRDFLVTPSSWNFLLQQTIGSPFDPHTAHLQSHVLQLRLPLDEPEQHRRLDEWWPTIMFAMTHAHHASALGQRSQTTLLDALDFTMNGYWLPRRNVPHDNWARNAFGSYEERNKAEFHDPFLSLAVKFGLQGYVEAQLATGEFPYKGGTPLLTYATQFLVHRQFTIYPLSSPSLVHVLLKDGADPNLVYKNMGGKEETPWLSALGYVRQACRRGWFEHYDTDEEGVTRVVGILRMMVEKGADVNAVIKETRLDPEITALGVVEEVWAMYGLVEMEGLREVMVGMGARGVVKGKEKEEELGG